MNNILSRWRFILKTRFGVAYSNFVLDRAFRPGIPSWMPVLMRNTFAVFAVIVTVAGIVFFVNKSTATIPDITKQGASIIETRISYAVAVDKYQKRLFILKETDKYYEVVRMYEISLGEVIGAKTEEGDLKTPEGFYKIISIKEDKELPKKYGPRAFVLDYPNRFDMANGRTGGGIWLHGSGKGKKTPDTRGCVELDDRSIVELGKWIDIDTPVAIFPFDFELPVVNGKIDKRFITGNFFYGDMPGVSAG
ncbi:MAG: hypothetical protein IEMM0002_0214 [bacterium]|nr:MAG: hypothetical protein IEMM0002_0214 [bacterium]